MKLDKFRNKLIVFEGIDKTGKTSVARAMVKYLNNTGIKAIFTFQPGDDNYGILAPLLRSLCKDKRWQIHDLTNFFLFLADKVEHVTKIVLPALKDGKTVICDRWWYSTFAYQLYGKQIIYKYDLDKDLQLSYFLSKISVLNLEPDMVFYFPFQIADIKEEKNVNDIYENMDTESIQRVRIAYEYLSQKYNFNRVIPGNNVEETLKKVMGV